jgi:hypothetical protein
LVRVEKFSGSEKFMSGMDTLHAQFPQQVSLAVVVDVGSIRVLVVYNPVSPMSFVVGKITLEV